MENPPRVALGFFRQSFVWTSSHIVRNVDLAALSRLSGDAA